MPNRTHRDTLGSVVGLLTFLGGVALLLLVFRLAYGLFGVSPEEALRLKPGQPIDATATGAAAGGILIRLLVLLLMGGVASLVANRGILLYSHCRGMKLRESRGDRSVAVPDSGDHEA